MENSNLSPLNSTRQERITMSNLVPVKYDEPLISAVDVRHGQPPRVPSKSSRRVFSNPKPTNHPSGPKQRSKSVERIPTLFAAGKSRKSFRNSISFKIPAFKLKRVHQEKKIVFGQEIDHFPSYDIWLEPLDEDNNKLFLDPREYTAFKRNDSNLPFTVLVGMILLSFFIVRGSFTTLWYLNFEYVIGFLAGCIFVIGMILSIVFRLSLLSYDYVILERLQPFYDIADNWTQQVKGHMLEDTIMISLAIATGMYVLARTLVGECPDVTNRWDIQSCNPQSSEHMVPTDTLVLDLLAPLAVQKFFTGASKRAVYLSWSITVTLVNVSLFCVHADFDSYVWVNLQFLLVMTISYEIERGFISRFIGKKLEETANDKNAALILELEAAKRYATESDMSSKRSMIRYINNEIRTPLNTIAGSTEALLLELKAMKKLINPQIIEIVMTTRENCAVVADVISDLLSFEKISTGTFRIELSPVAILNYILELARPFVASARSKGVDFTFEKFHCPDQIMVQIDPVKMGQVVRNIFLNAVNFTNSGQILVTLMTHKRDNGESLVTISVKDSGSGLSRIKLLQLFDDRIKFNTIGSGLGLYVSKEIIKLHKGAHLWAESDGEGKGSTFFIQILAVEMDSKGEWDVDVEQSDPNPKSTNKIQANENQLDGQVDISAPDPNDHPNAVNQRSLVNGRIGFDTSNDGKTSSAHISSPPPIPLSGSRGNIAEMVSSGSRGNIAGMNNTPSLLVPPMRVLVVDDSKLHRKTLTRMLSLDKHAVSEASNGLEAFAQIRRMFIVRDGVINDTSDALVFDAIVMDNNMPKMSGTDAALEIRRIGFLGPIIGIVGDPDCLEKYKQNGADQVLIKPVNRQTLATTLRDVLDQKIVQKKGQCNELSNDLNYMKGTTRQKDPSQNVVPSAPLEKERRQSKTAQRRQSRKSSTNSVTRLHLLQLMSGNRSPEDESRGPGDSTHGGLLHVVSSKSSGRHIRPEVIKNGSNESQNNERSVKHPIRSQSMMIRGSLKGSSRHNQVAPHVPGILSEDRGRAPSGELRPEGGSVHNSFDAGDNDMDMEAMEAIRLDVSLYTDVMLNFKGKSFNTREIRMEYKDFRLSNLNLRLGIVCLILTTIFVATRFSLEHLWYLNPTFSFVFFCYCAFMLCIMVSFFFKFAGNYSYDWPLLQRYHEVWLSFSTTGVAYIIDDGIIVFVSLATSFNMLARVLQGPCPMDFSMWYQQQCNPEAIVNAVPQETLIFMTFSIIVWQVFINGSSRGAIAFSWLIVIVLLNVNLYLVKSNLYLWHNLGFGWLIAVSYELERFQITTFIYQRLLAIANSRRQLVETSNSQLNNERDMYISVSDELRNTISNAAHDLTSPCSAVGLAVESVLKTFLTQSLAQTPSSVGGAFGLQGNKDYQQVLEVLWDVFYAMMTLHMIINRATDYNKIITGVKLVPSPRPVDIRECLINVIHSCGTLRVVGSVRRMESSAQLASHSNSNVDNDDDPEGNDIAPLHDPGVIALSNISDDIPDEIMTDLSWLRDNLMCIIGNAVKYSVASVLINVKTVSSGGNRMLEIDVQDSGADKLSPTQLKALFDRPIQFAREAVGGMGVGLFCMGERCKALGGESGARLRLDNKSGVVVWFRIPLERCPPGKKATKSELFMLKEQQLERYQQYLNQHIRSENSVSASRYSSHKSLSNKHFLHSGSQKKSAVIDELNKSVSRQVSRRAEIPSLSPSKDITAALDRPPAIQQSNNNNNNNNDTNTDSKQQTQTPSKVGSKATPDGSPRVSRRASPRGSASRTGSGKAESPVVGGGGGRKAAQNNEVTNVMAIEGTLAVAAGPLTGLHILAVDDSAAILKMMVRMLAGAGAVVTSARDGREAVTLAERTAFNVVVTDIQMPHLDGFGEAKQIRKIEQRLLHTPNERVPAIIVGISAKSDPKCHADALEAGMNSFVPKPFRLQELIEIMDNFRLLAGNLSTSAVAVDHPPAEASTVKPIEETVGDIVQNPVPRDDRGDGNLI